MSAPRHTPPLKAPGPVPDVEAIAADLAASRQRYREILRVPSMSVGVYRLAVGQPDPQSPHRQDELYVVVRGRARFVTPDGSRSVARGDLLFVPAGRPHRFEGIVAELVVLVVFAPPESGSGSATADVPRRRARRPHRRSAPNRPRRIRTP